MAVIQVSDDLTVAFYAKTWLVEIASKKQMNEELSGGFIFVKPGDLPALIEGLERARDGLLAGLGEETEQ